MLERGHAKQKLEPQRKAQKAHLEDFPVQAF
jgi:Tfp pilus assembly protein PilP